MILILLYLLARKCGCLRDIRALRERARAESLIKDVVISVDGRKMRERCRAVKQPRRRFFAVLRRHEFLCRKRLAFCVTRPERQRVFAISSSLVIFLSGAFAALFTVFIYPTQTSYRAFRCLAAETSKWLAADYASQSPEPSFIFSRHQRPILLCVRIFRKTVLIFSYFRC